MGLSSGTYTPPSPEFPVIGGTDILASDFNTIITDITAALSAALYRDGQVAATADIPMGTFKFTGLGAGSASTDSVNYGQVFGGSNQFSGTHDYNISGATVLVSTQAPGDNTMKAASTAFVTQASFTSSLPGQTGNNGKFLKTDGVNASWDAPLNTFLTNLSSLATAADKLFYSTGVGTVAENPLTAFIRTLLDDADAVTALATLGAIAKSGTIAFTGTQTFSDGMTDQDFLLKSGTRAMTGNLNMNGNQVLGSISGNAATVTNGVYTTGNQTIAGVKTFSSQITGSISGNCGGSAATVTNGVYTTGNQTIAGTKTFSSPLVGDITGSSGSCTGNAATATAVVLRGALAELSASITGHFTANNETLITTAGTWTEAYDTTAIHDGGIMTVPAGVTKIRLSGQVAFASGGTGARFAQIVKLVDGTAIGNAQYVAGLPAVTWDNAALSHVGSGVMTSAIIAVTAGDKFCLWGLTSSGTLDCLAGNRLGSVYSSTTGATWISMEVIG